MLPLRLASARRCIGFLTLVIEQVSHAAELFGGGLQSFDLLAQLSLLCLFLTQHLVDIPHSFGLLIEL
jgi:hypothetical protein